MPHRSATLPTFAFRIVLALLSFSVCSSAADPLPLTFETADARMRRATLIARETNSKIVVDRVLEIRDAIKQAFTKNSKKLRGRGETERITIKDNLDLANTRRYSNETRQRYETISRNRRRSCR